MSTRVGSGRSRRPPGNSGRSRSRGPRPDNSSRAPLPLQKKREPTVVLLPQGVPEKALAEALNVAGGQIIKELISRGMILTIKQAHTYAVFSDFDRAFSVVVKQKASD